MIYYAPKHPLLSSTDSKIPMEVHLMRKELSSRERMMAAIECREPDYVPLCFMIFSALKSKCKDQYEFAERQLELGLDAVIDLPVVPLHVQSYYSDLHGPPVRFDPRVRVKEWREDRADEKYPLLYKEYVTPAGTLRTVVSKAEDWPYGDHVPLFDDYLIPRSKEFLITDQSDLKRLEYLFMPPSEEDISEFKQTSRRAREFADSRGLLVTGGWGVGIEAACWMCGIEGLILAAIYDPGFVEEMARLIARWNQERMQAILDVGVDLFIRRGWYESADFWPPDLYRQFILPSLQREVQMAHQAGARFGYIMTTGTMPLLDILLESGIDVLIGVDPVQGRGTDLPELKRKLNGKICMWGGVNGFVTVEMGSKQEIEQAVETAISILAPGGGFILSPVDNIRDTSEDTWENVQVMIEAWKRQRAGS
jgi:uroporphyrinogen-III decarboxylase